MTTAKAGYFTQPMSYTLPSQGIKSSERNEATLQDAQSFMNTEGYAKPVSTPTVTFGSSTSTRISSGVQASPIAASPGSHQKRSSSYEVHMQGALEKQGRLKPWSWKKYWFLLADEHLCYYRNNKKDLSSHRTVDLTKAENVFRLSQSSRGFPLEVSTKSRRHVLVAPTSESCDQWVTAIHKAIVIGRRKLYNLSRASCDSISDDDGGSQSKKSRGSISSSSTSANTTPSTPDTPPLLWAKSPTLSTPRSRQVIRGRSNGNVLVGREVTFTGRSVGEVDSIGDVDDEHLDSKAPLRRLSRGIHVNQETRSSYFTGEDEEALPNNSEGGSAVRGHAVMSRPYFKSIRGHVSESSSDLDGDVFVKDGGYTSSRESRDVPDNASIESNLEIDSTLKRGAIGIAANRSYASFGQLTSSDYCSESEMSVGTVSITDETAALSPAAGNNKHSNWSLLDMLVAVQGYYGDERKEGWHFSPIPSLPHPRLEMTWDSPFDGIRVFLAQTRDPTEIFAVQRRRSDKRGFAIAQLRELLRSLDGDEDEVLCSTRL